MAREYNGNRGTNVRKAELVAYGLPKPGSEAEKIRDAYVEAFAAKYPDPQEATTHRANYMLLEGKKLLRGKPSVDERDLLAHYRRIVARHPVASKISEQKRAEMIAEFLPRYAPQVAKQFKPDEVKRILREFAKDMPPEDVARALPGVAAKLQGTRASKAAENLGQKYKRFKLLAAVIGAIAITGSGLGGYALGAKSSHAQEAKTTQTEQTQTTQQTRTLPSGLVMDYQNMGFQDAIKQEIQQNARQKFGVQVSQSEIQGLINSAIHDATGDRPYLGPEQDYVAAMGDYIKKVQQDPNYFDKLDNQYLKLYINNLGHVPTDADAEQVTALYSVRKIFEHRNAIEAAAQKYTPEDIEKIEQQVNPDWLASLRKYTGFKHFLETAGSSVEQLAP